MAEETVTSPETEVTPETEEVVTDQPGGEEEQLTEALPEEDEEFELDGETFKAPKKVKEAVMRHADYTQKTQSLAKEREADESKRKEFVAYQEEYRANVKEFSEITSMNNQIEEYNKLDWDKLIDEDPVQAQKLQLQLNRLVNERNQRANVLSQKENERRSKMQQETARREEDGRSTLQREIKGWNPDIENKLREYAKSNGVPAETAKVHNFALSPHETKILHKAYLYDQLVKKQASQKPAADPIKPAPEVKGGKSSSGPTEYRVGMTGAAYDAWRAKQKPKR